MEEENKKPALCASIAPDKFDWDAFESEADVYGNVDKKEIAEAYDKTLSKVVENEVVEGTVTAINKRKSSSTSATRAKASSPPPSSATTLS